MAPGVDMIPGMHVLAHVLGYSLTVITAVATMTVIDDRCVPPPAPNDPWVEVTDATPPSDPWGPCSASEIACSEGAVCWTQSPELGMCVLEPPCPSGVQIDGETFASIDLHLGCPLPCERDRECLPDRGMLCGETGSCGWEVRI